MAPPTMRDIYRYRKQYGVNLAGWFVLQRWVDSRPFDGIAHGNTDLEVAVVHDARKIFEQHWDNFMQDADWEWLGGRGINTVRLPIGYYHVVGASPDLLDSTDFAAYAGLYRGAWFRILNAIAKAAQHGIGVLVDLHVAPGGEFHSGHSWQPDTKLWSLSNLSVALRTYQLLVANLSPIENVVGLSLLNEPPSDPRLIDWYNLTVDTLRIIDADFPLYISGTQFPDICAHAIGKRSDFVVLDHHIYRSADFTVGEEDFDGKAKAEQARTGVREVLKELYRKTAGKLIIGEWAAAVFPRSASVESVLELNTQTALYGLAQLEVYIGECSGQYFSTYKREPRETSNVGWSLQDAVREGVMPNCVGLMRQDDNIALLTANAKAAAKEKWSGSYRTFWAMQPHPRAYQHWRFDAGFMEGFEDQKDFAKLSPGVALGCIGFPMEWAKRRRAEHEQSFGGDEFLWEFDEGFQHGYQAALEICLDGNS